MNTVLFISLFTLPLFSQTTANNPPDKSWAIVIEGYYFGLSKFSPNNDGTTSLSQKVSQAIYDSPASEFLPAPNATEQLSNIDLTISGFKLFFDNTYNCYISHTDKQASAELKEKFKVANIKPYWLKDPNDTSSPEPIEGANNQVPALHQSQQQQEFIDLLTKQIHESNSRIAELERKLDLSLQQHQRVHSNLTIDSSAQPTMNDREFQFSVMKKIEKLEDQQKRHQHLINTTTLQGQKNDGVPNQDNTQQSDLQLTNEAQQSGPTLKADAASTLSREEIFMQAFGKKSKNTPKTYQAELIVDNQNNKIFTNIDLNTNSMESGPLLKAISDVVFPDSLKRVTEKISNSALTFKDLNRLGIKVVNDQATYSCYVTLPPSWYMSQKHSLGDELKVEKNYVYPSAFSGYLNARGRKRFIRLDEKEACDSTCLDNLIIENNTEAKPVSINFDGSVNIFSVVTEASGSYYQGSSDQPYSVYNIRSTKDIVPLKLRLTAGEISGKAGGGLHGIGVSQNKIITSDINAEKLSDIEFELKTASEVKVYINDRLETILQLPPGEHSITDFPNVHQENHVELQITDHAGKQQKLEFDFLNNKGQLNGGKSSWEAAIGYPKTSNILDQQFNNDSLGISAFYNKALLSWITVGVGGAYKLYGDHKTNFNTLFNFSPVNVTLDYDESYFNSVVGWRTQAGISGTFQNYAEMTQRYLSTINWRFSAEYRSEHYNSSSYTKFSTPMIQFASGLGVALPNATRIGAQLGYIINRDTLGYLASTNNTRSVTLNLSKSWDDMSAGFIVGFEGGDIQGNDLTMGANIQYNFDAGNHTFRVSDRLTQQVKDNATATPDATLGPDVVPVKEWANQGAVSWTYTDFTHSTFNPSAGANATLTSEFNDAGVSTNIFSPWGTVSGSHRVIDQQNQYANAIQHESSVGVHVGLAWAGTSVAITRPINGSYALIRGKDNMFFRSIRVNPQGNDEEQTKAYPLFPAVIPTVSDHNVTKVVIDPDLPLGSLPVDNTYHLVSEYKSGFEIKVGSVTASVILGTLLHETGKPFERQIFRLYRLTATNDIDPNTKSITSFTSQTGRFQSPGIISGKYLIKLMVDGFEYSVILNILNTDSGLLEIGDITLKSGAPDTFTVTPSTFMQGN